MHEEIFRMTATTMAGLEPTLEEELKSLGAMETALLSRAVAFKGGTELMYEANYRCRTALRILKPVVEFDIAAEDELYKNIYQFEWENILTPEKTFAVEAVVFSSLFTHSQYVALKVKDAIADRFRMKLKVRPSVNLEKPDLRIHLHLSHNHCTVSLDSSGVSLHKRGYRKAQMDAPISEVLAAGMVLLSGWDKNSPLVDPMCGSGTILIEAALIANNIPSGFFRDYFGFRQWTDFDPALWEKVKSKAAQDVVESESEITGCDISAKSIEAAKANLYAAKLHKDIQLKNQSIQDFQPPLHPGFLVTNPPYGERIKPSDIIHLYKVIGDTLKQKYTGYNAWVISSHSEALKFVGLKPSRKIILFNGPLECRFVNFQIYEGSKKEKKQ